MAPFNLDRWNKYSCAVRCLLKLHEEVTGIEILPKTVYDKFLPEYPDWKSEPGATDTVLLVRIMLEYKICTGAVGTIDPQKILDDYPRPNVVGVIGFMEWDFSEDVGFSKTDHAVIIEPERKIFTLRSPLAGSSDFSSDRVPWHYWHTRAMRALILTK